MQMKDNYFYQELIDKIRSIPDNRWQPIETAPKDGTWIDIWTLAKKGTCGGVQDAVSWDEGTWRWPSCSSSTKGSESWFPGYDLCEHWTPTHWRPWNGNLLPEDQGPDLKKMLLSTLAFLNRKPGTDMFFKACTDEFPNEP